MTGLYIVNYRHESSEPLKSITQLPKEEAFAVAKELYANSSCKAHRRFGADFPSYYEYRMKIERLLYSEFITMGGKPETEHPYYFALQYCDSLCRNFEKPAEIRIKLDTIDPCHISFTLGDSMAQMEKTSEVKPFLRDTLIKHIIANGSAEPFLEKSTKEYSCIEVQLWTDRYF